jgi:phosphoribosylformimino-5-aminoimidazole carboxamide ribotide isomerase
MSFTLFPAIDIRAGRVVRLAQGDYQRQTGYDFEPVALARSYADQGAGWLHLVDLDAARLGGYSQQALLTRLKTETGLEIQTGGGVRSEREIETLLAAGASRVVIGTLAVREPDKVAGWLSHFGPDRITLALDTRQDASGAWRLPVSGWTMDSALRFDDLLARYVGLGLRHLLCTDIQRDGMMSGFNLDLYRGLAKAWPTLKVQASGGVRGIEDIRAAREAGAAVAILGRALIEQQFSLREALFEERGPC